jgi:hypothetical protein
MRIVYFIIAIIFIAFGIYYFNGFYSFINDIVFADSRIPSEHKDDVYYFLDAKINAKNYTAYFYIIIMSVLSFILIKNKLKDIKVLGYLTLLFLFLWSLYFIVVPKAIFIF